MKRLTSFSPIAALMAGIVLCSPLAASDKKHETLEIRLSANGTSGGSSSFHLNGSLDWERREKTSVWDADVWARFQNGSGGTLSDRNYGARLGNRFDLNGHGDYGFGEVYGEVDDKRNVTFRGDVAGGLGKYLIETHETQFRGQVGLAFVWLNQSNPTQRNDYWGLYLGWNLDQRLSSEWSLEHNFRFLPSLDGFRDYSLLTDAKLRARVNEKTSVFFSVEQQYETLLNDSKSRNRFTYSMGVTYKF